jgi:hypothetical protein
MIRRITLPAIVCAGTAGSAVGSGTTPEPVNGFIIAVYLDYSASCASTTDVTVVTVSAPAITILSKADNKTDGWFNPRVQINLNTDGSAISAQYGQMAIDDYIKVSVAQNDAGETVTPTLIVWDVR